MWMGVDLTSMLSGERLMDINDNLHQDDLRQDDVYQKVLRLLLDEAGIVLPETELAALKQDTAIRSCSMIFSPASAPRLSLYRLTVSLWLNISLWLTMKR